MYTLDIPKIPLKRKKNFKSTSRFKGRQGNTKVENCFYLMPRHMPYVKRKNLDIYLEPRAELNWEKIIGLTSNFKLQLP